MTGITVGVSMSGDLKDPAKSIPLGTISAIVITGFIYLAVALWLGANATTAELVHDNMIMMKIARWPFLHPPGRLGLHAFLGPGRVLAAPRTLQAIAIDHVVPKFFGAQMGSATEPRLAALITTALAVTVIWLGNLISWPPSSPCFFSTPTA